MFRPRHDLGSAKRRRGFVALGHEGARRTAQHFHQATPADGARPTS